LKIAITVKYFSGKGGKHGSKNLGYVIHGIGWSPGRIHGTYRSRFSIESSYRNEKSGESKDFQPKSPVSISLYYYRISPEKYLVVLLWKYFLSIQKRA